MTVLFTNAVSKTNARAEVMLLQPQDARGNAVLSGQHEDAGVKQEIGLPVVALRYRGEEIIAQAQAEGEPRRRMPLILHEGAVLTVTLVGRA